MAAAAPDEPVNALLQLSLDVLGVVGFAIGDPLRPSVAGAFAATCVSLQGVMVAPLAKLAPQHVQAKALAAKLRMSCAGLREAKMLEWGRRDLTAADMATLGMVLGLGSVPKLNGLSLVGNRFGADGATQLCAGLGCGAAPHVINLVLGDNNIGPAGAAALAAAFSRGALPKLAGLRLGTNQLGDDGAVALAGPLRQLRELKRLHLEQNGIGDRGVAALVDNLGPKELRALEALGFFENQIGDAGCASLAAAIDAGSLLKIKEVVWKKNAHPDTSEYLWICNNPASVWARLGPSDAARRAVGRC